MKTDLGGGDDSEESRNRLQPGDTVRVIDGPFKDCSGTINRINDEHAKLIVEVRIFGQKPPVELEFLQVERL